MDTVMREYYADGTYRDWTPAELVAAADRLLGLTAEARPGPRPDGEPAADILTPRQLARRRSREIPFGGMADFNPLAVGIATHAEYRARRVG